MKRVSLLIIKSLILIDVLGCESHSCHADLVPVSASPKYYRYDKFPSKSLSVTTDFRSGHYDTSVHFVSIENLCRTLSNVCAKLSKHGSHVID